MRAANPLENSQFTLVDSSVSERYTEERCTGIRQHDYTTDEVVLSDITNNFNRDVVALDDQARYFAEAICLPNHNLSHCAYIRLPNCGWRSCD